MWTELIDGSVSVHRIKSSLTAKKLFVPAATWNKFILVLRNNFRLFDMPEHKNSFILKATEMHKHTTITIKTLNLCLRCVLVREVHYLQLSFCVVIGGNTHTMCVFIKFQHV